MLYNQKNKNASVYLNTLIWKVFRNTYKSSIIMELYILTRTLLCKWVSTVVTCKICSSRLHLSRCIHFICLSGRNILLEDGKYFQVELNIGGRGKYILVAITNIAWRNCNVIMRVLFLFYKYARKQNQFVFTSIRNNVHCRSVNDKEGINCE